STRCLSYLTIENKGPVAVDQRAAIAEHAYGCDICQEVCPWNRAPADPHPAFVARQEYRATPITDLLKFGQADFSRLFTKSAVKRAKLAGMQRNVKAISVLAESERAPDDRGID
ncbi:MAG: 4Fe-4S double cluster binding domain-containing protein, partial [Thermoanaerobaculia bacterium]